MEFVMQGVKVHAASSRVLLDGIGFTVPSGTVTVILGRTGAGKTTLLEAAAGLREAQEGTLTYGGEPLRKGKRLNPALRFGIGYAGQEPEKQLCAVSVEAELAGWLRPLKLDGGEIERRRTQALAAVGLPADAAFLRQAPLTLSGGQKRRLAVAAVLAAEPAWLLLDEPTAGLDPDAAARLAGRIRGWAAQGGGVLLATHDAEAFLPVADFVLILDEGRSAFFGTREALCSRPEPLRRAGLALPAALELAERLQARGYALPAGLLPPERLAAELAPQLAARPRAREALPERPRPAAGRSAAPAAPLPREAESPLAAVDPRALWVFLLAVSVGIWQQRDWPGLLLATTLTAALIAYSRIPLHTMAKAVRPLVFFIVLAVLASGLAFTGSRSGIPFSLGFSWEQAAISFQRLYRLLLILLTGLLLPLSTSQLRLKRGIEQSLAFANRWRLPIEAFALTTSLLFHFVPLLAAEWDRFVRIGQMRNRAAGRNARLRIADLAGLALPFLLSLLQLAEQTVLALEARGYKRLGQKRTHAVRLVLKRKDYLFMLAGILLGSAFILLS